jgi:hypothetical protein
MTEYKCSRCGYTTNRSNNLKKHLSTKIICSPILEDINRKIVYDSVFTKNYKFECDFCNKKYKTKESLNHHKLKFHKNDIQSKVTQAIKELLPKEQQIPKVPKDELIVKIQTLENTCKNQKKKISQLLLNIELMKKNKNEQFYQRLLENFLDGHHKILKVGVTDVTTENSHCEIKEWRQWKDAIGQLLSYNHEDPKEKLCVYLFGNYDELKKTNAFNILSNLKLIVYEFIEDKNDIHIIKYDDKTIIYKFNYVEVSSDYDALIEDEEPVNNDVKVINMEIFNDQLGI